MTTNNTNTTPLGEMVDGKTRTTAANEKDATNALGGVNTSQSNEPSKRTKIAATISAAVKRSLLETKFNGAVAKLIESTRRGNSGYSEYLLKEMVNLTAQMAAVGKTLEEGPASKALKMIQFAEEIGTNAASLGGHYSGDTEYAVRIHSGPDNAYTSRRYGDQYSSKCKWHKTNAMHVVELNEGSLSRLFCKWGRQLVEASRSDSARRIVAVGAGKGSVKWVEAGRGKTIKLVDGWACMAGRNVVFSEKSYKEAFAAATKLVAQAL